MLLWQYWWWYTCLSSIVYRNVPLVRWPLEIGLERRHEGELSNIHPRISELPPVKEAPQALYPTYSWAPTAAAGLPVLFG